MRFPRQKMKSTSTAFLTLLHDTDITVDSYAIKWEVYQSDVAGAKIESWLNKKVSEILGFEEASLTSVPIHPYVKSVRSVCP